MADNKTVNRWAKVLNDAGLLDDAQDMWELPAERAVNGATIQVGKNEPPSPPQGHCPEESFASVMEEEDPYQRVTRESIPVTGVRDVNETTEHELRIESTVEPSHEDSTTRVSYSTGTKNESGLPRGENSPFSRVTPTEALSRPTRIPLPPEPRDTDPAPLARYSMTAAAHPVTPDQDSMQTGRQRPLLSSESVEHISRERSTGIQVPHWDGDNAAMASGDIVDEPPGPGKSLAPQKPDLRSEMAMKYDMGDFSGALHLAEEILSLEPDSLDALQYRKSCREKLQRMYEARIGDMHAVPRIRVSNHELMWRNLDASSGFVLSRVDGMSNYEIILDISGLPRFETCRILHQLLQDEIIY